MTDPNNPSPPSPPPGAPARAGGGPETRIIRRAPTGPLPQAVDDARTTHIPRPPAPPQPDFSPRPDPGPVRVPFGEPSKTTAVAASAVSIVSGWAT